jgi:hypothetical protein
MTPWLVVLAVEAAAIAVVLLAARHLSTRIAETVARWGELDRELRPAFVALRAEQEATAARLDALQRRSTGTTRQ